MHFLVTDPALIALNRLEIADALRKRGFIFNEVIVWEPMDEDENLSETPSQVSATIGWDGEV